MSEREDSTISLNMKFLFPQMESSLKGRTDDHCGVASYPILYIGLEQYLLVSIYKTFEERVATDPLGRNLVCAY